MPFNLADYEPVEDRLRAFWEDYPGGRVVTVLIDHADGHYLVRAEVFREEGSLPAASGLAEESTTDRGVNSTSALENCETSAIGRALANLGYAAKGKRPSREEMSKTSPAPGPAGTAGAGTTEQALTARGSAPQAGDHQSPPANGEVTAATVPGEGSGSPFSPSSGTTLGPDQPGPPHYPLRPDECDHRNEKSGHLLRPRKSPRGPVCPRCGLSYITVTESTTADLGSA